MRRRCSRAEPAPRGMTPEGESAVAGLVAGLPEAQGVLCGSILSGLRMQPGHWSGAYVCWGTENREAAVRFLIGGAEQSTRRQRRGEGHRPVGESVLRDGDDSRARARRHRAQAVRCRRRRPSTPPPSPTRSATQAGIKLLASSQADALDCTRPIRPGARHSRRCTRRCRGRGAPLRAGELTAI